MRWTVITVILACLLMGAAPAAQADGDPASDVLVTYRYFDPRDLTLAPAQTAELNAVLVAADRAGLPLRVALIASPGDLGTVTPYWGHAVAYASFLQTELSLLYRGQILVVMPSGFGLVGPRQGAARVTAPELAVRALSPGPGARLAEAALSALPRLAAADGHPIPPAALGRALRTAPPPTPPTATGAAVEELVALLAGGLLIALAWAASLRTRPLGTRRGLPT